MKTRSIIYTLSITLLAGSLALTSCKKRKEFKNEDGQTSADNRAVQGENDAAISDINSVIGDHNYLHGKGGTSQLPAILSNPLGCTPDTVGLPLGTMYLKFDGTVYNNRKREGKIKLTIVDYALNKRWKDAGCQILVEYISYKVTRASDGKSVELNGTQTVTNETGGLWYHLLFLNQPTLAHSVTGTNLNCKFDDGKTAVYNINRKFTYSKESSLVIRCVGEGIGSNDGISSLENWGTTRNGDNFTSQVTTPIIWNTTCGAWAPIQGAVNIKVQDKSFDLRVTFGVDSDGNSISVAPNNCAYGFKVEWTHRNKTKKKIFNYF